MIMHNFVICCAVDQAQSYSNEGLDFGLTVLRHEYSSKTIEILPETKLFRKLNMYEVHL